MKLQRRLANHGFPFELKPSPSRKDIISINRNIIPDTVDNYNKLYNYFSEILFEAFESHAQLLYIDLVLIDSLRDFSNLKNFELEEFENTYVFFLDDSFGSWEYTLLPNTKKTQERYRLDSLILTVIQDSSDAKIFESHYETYKEDNILFVKIPLILIKNLHFREHF